MCKYWHNVGAWRSLVARLFRVQEAVSSNLAAPTKLKIENRLFWRFFFYAPAVLLFLAVQPELFFVCNILVLNLGLLILRITFCK